MPAYSFKEQFVPMVLDGSKKQTIRSRRKNRSKEGDTLFLYYGLRTRFTKKLREEKCSATASILITENGVALFDDDLFYRIMLNDLLSEILCTQIDFCKLNQVPHTDFCLLLEKGSEKLIIDTILPAGDILLDRFAWRDGFRPEGSSLEQPGEAFNLMLHFWKQSNTLPWFGDVVYWEPTQSETNGKTL